jgi:hypothetical protein
MQNRFSLILAAALVVCSTAQAAAPSARATLSPAVLGEVDGILSSCIKIDPSDAAKFEKIRLSLIPVDDRDDSKSEHDSKKGAVARDGHESSDFWEKIQENPGYRANFTLMQSTFSNMPPAEALTLCKGAV